LILILYNESTISGLTPLHTAVVNGMLEVVKKLFKEFDSELDVNSINAPNACTPVYLAAQEGNIDMIEYLFKRHADINKANANGATPLLIAALKGHFDVVQRLIQHGAKVDVTDVTGVTPLIYAIQGRHFDVARFLVEEAGANVNFDLGVNSAFCSTALTAAICSESYELANLIISRETFVPNSFHGIPSELMQAIIQGNFNIFDLLLTSNKFSVTEEFFSIVKELPNINQEIIQRLGEFLNSRGVMQENDDVELPDIEQNAVQITESLSESEELTNEEDSSELEQIVPELDREELSPQSNETRNAVSQHRRRRRRLIPFDLPHDAFASYAVTLQDLDYNEFVGNQILRWEAINIRFQLARPLPLRLDLHTNGPVRPQHHVNNFMQVALPLLRERQYNGDLILITGRGNNSTNHISRVKLEMLSFLQQNSIPYNGHPTNPGCVILHFENGVPIRNA